jgi:DNA polymerase III alpha subunit
MAANVDWASSAEEQEKLITKVVDVLSVICSMVMSHYFYIVREAIRFVM